MRRSARRRAAWAAATALGAAALAAACADGLPRERPPALHAVHSSTIRARMAQLERLTVGELGGGTTTRRDVARVAAELAETAARLPDLIASVDMDADDRSHFVVFADALRGRALRLAEAAPTAPPEALAARVEEITDTCVVCHQGFRVAPPDRLD